MTKDELILFRKFPHTLEGFGKNDSNSEFGRRCALIQREIRIDTRWGFFDHSLFGAFKRALYKIFIHPVVKKQDIKRLP